MAKKEWVKEWLKIAKKDLEEAEFLFSNRRPTEDVVYFLQQAAEKSLKGYLIYQGWKLQKIHDIRTILQEAVKFDKSFERFIPIAAQLTEFYFKSRYPPWEEIDLEEEEIEEKLSQVKKLFGLIEAKII
ncbi:MAG: HEPN domain-containing protein [Candidatus Zixiibacteriota bacterium]